MNVLLVAPQPFYQERGTPIAVRLLAETLCEFGHHVDLLVYHEGEDVVAERLRLVRARRPLGVGRVPIGISVPKLLCDAMLVVRMLGLLRRRRYDVIHAVEEAIFPAVIANRYARARLVYDMDSSLADQLTDKWRFLRTLRGTFVAFERAAVRRATATVAVCEDLAAKVRPWVGPERVVVLPDVPLPEAEGGAAVESLRARLPADAVLGLYVGNLERYQGIDLLLDALERVPPAAPLRVVVIGGIATDVARYRAAARTRGLEERIDFLGPRPIARLGAYLRQADLLLSPRTLGRNTPMKVYSYMQAGKVIVATDIRTHTQALDSSCALLVAPTPEAYAAGLVRATDDVELRVRLGAAARERAERDYSLGAYRGRLRELYDRLAAGG